MARRKNAEGCGSLLILLVGLFLLTVAWENRHVVVPIVILLVTAAVVVQIIGFFQHRRRVRAIQIANVDMMTGVGFEEYLRQVLLSRGYRVDRTPVTGDQGVDLIATKAGERIAIQVKRYENGVSRRAVSDAVAGMQYYRCNRAMVITNSRSPQAQNRSLRLQIASLWTAIP